MSRTENTIKNIKYAIAGQAINLIIGFISRKVFISVLGASYLGLSGLFTSILSVLSLAELGIGSAINFSLYKPLADKNETELISIMSFYKKVYYLISLVILLLGLGITPLLFFFLKEIPNVPQIQLIFILFVANSSISYLFSYKRSIINTDQKRYITIIYYYGFSLALHIVQITLLVLTKNYILFLLLQICSTLIENILISRKADKLYPFLKNHKILKLDKHNKDEILRNTKAMIFHKAGATIVLGTDNLLISKFIGLIEVGLYSNYNLILTGLNSIYNQLFNSVLASVGNLGATESKEKNLSIFERLDLFTFWLYGFSSICLVVLINPFITIWLGKDYTLPFSFVITIIINFYIIGMRKSVLTFKDALGLFWHDRYKPIFESIINLVLSIILVKYFGITGIFLGTIFSSLLTCFWIEPYVVYKYGFDISMGRYFINYSKNSVLLLLTGYITWYLSNFILSSGLAGIILKFLCCLTIPNLIFYVRFRKDERFNFILSIAKNKIFKNGK